MTTLQNGLADFSQYAATRKWQLLMAAAVTSFMVCHTIVQQTLPDTMGSSRSIDGAMERQLLHFMAELLRFALPYGFLAWGATSYWRSRSKRALRDE